MTNQINEKVFTRLMLISFIFVIGTVISMIVIAHLPKQNCWDKYPHNENQAILNCEGKNK